MFVYSCVNIFRRITLMFQTRFSSFVLICVNKSKPHFHALFSQLTNTQVIKKITIVTVLDSDNPDMSCCSVLEDNNKLQRQRTKCFSNQRSNLIFYMTLGQMKKTLSLKY